MIFLFPYFLVIRRMAEEDLHPSLRNIIEQESLNWIFVGGKGAIYYYHFISIYVTLK
jgi:hypothetical protein